MDRRTYTVNVKPLRSMDREVATVIPDADVLGEVDWTNLHVSGFVLLLAFGEVMTAAFKANGGTVYEFMGDGVMAF